MKNCKMAFTIGLVFAVMMLVAACTDSSKSDNHIFDHESLDVDEYVYPSDFDLGDDLKVTNSESDAGFEELSAMIGTYHYTSDYGTGRLMIEATEDGIDISDYESEDTYRFLANETNVKNEEENKNIEIEQVTKSTYDYKNYKEITLYHTSTKKTEKVPLDEYLYGVVSAEMPASFEEEALKAQAVVARTYTLYKIQNSKRKT